MHAMTLPDGCSEVACGKIAAIVTCLSMDARAAPRAQRADAPWRLVRIEQPQLPWYRDLFRRVGEEWLWHSRLAMAPENLEAIIRHPDVAIHALRLNERDEGLLELDFRHAPHCELAFFGLTATVRGAGAGRWLMNRALEYAWARPIARFWVHTCTLDHPGALEFYLRSGFRAYARQIEIVDDPRLTGLAPRTAAPQVPILEPPR
jgi:GNAT superfamily N-acetyltransferase